MHIVSIITTLHVCMSVHIHKKNIQTRWILFKYFCKTIRRILMLLHPQSIIARLACVNLCAYASTTYFISPCHMHYETQICRLLTCNNSTIFFFILCFDIFLLLIEKKNKIKTVICIKGPLSALWDHQYHFHLCSM